MISSQRHCRGGSRWLSDMDDAIKKPILWSSPWSAIQYDNNTINVRRLSAARNHNRNEQLEKNWEQNVYMMLNWRNVFYTLVNFS